MKTMLVLVLLASGICFAEPHDRDARTRRDSIDSRTDLNYTLKLFEKQIKALTEDVDFFATGYKPEMFKDEFAGRSFVRDSKRMKESYFSGDETSFARLLEKLNEAAARCNSGPVVITPPPQPPMDPCRGIPPTYKTEPCSHKGTTRVSSFDCKGNLISTVEQNCEVDLKKYQCTSCVAYYSQNLGAYAASYQVFFAGKQVEAVEVKEGYGSATTKECEIRKKADTLRCANKP